ncbi:MAG: PGPGW domain-containing protein [Sneathiella sp.]
MPKKIFRAPKSKIGRLLLGWALVVGGIFGFLPILGFWMIPLGVIILSADSPYMRRLRRRTEVWIGRKRGRNTARKNQKKG